MPEMLYRTAFDSAPGGKRRVYFTCHPEDFEKYFERICQEVLELQDVVIYYTKNMTETFAEKELETDLGSNNLFIVPVTYRLLSKPNRAMDQDLAYAKEKHIPILPFMMEPGLDEIYARPDKFGELQYLQPDAEDKTAISFREKLRKYLEAVLVSDETVKRIQAAFDAYIFLSYRKKDRSYANELMRLIHKDPRYRDVAIWYDEFLTPGESFRKNIDKMLQKSDLFALLVTPSLLEEPDGKPNFVMAEEFPAARDAGKTILPAQMEQTDEEQLSKKFAGIPPCADPRQEKAFRDRLAETLDRLAKEENTEDPEHNFLIGLAYLEGIDVEVNREAGTKMIIDASKEDLPEAIEWMLKNERDVEIRCRTQGEDKPDWIAMAQKLIALQTKAHGQNSWETLYAMHLLARQYNSKEKQELLEIRRRTFRISRKVLGIWHPDTIYVLHEIARLQARQKPGRAGIIMVLCFFLRMIVLGKDDNDSYSSLTEIAFLFKRKNAKLCALKIAYYITKWNSGAHHSSDWLLRQIVTVYKEYGEYRRAIKWQKKLCRLRYQTGGKLPGGVTSALEVLAQLYGNINDEKNRIQTEQILKAHHTKRLEEMIQEFTSSSSKLEADHPNILGQLNTMGELHYELGQYEASKECYEKSLARMKVNFNTEENVWGWLFKTVLLAASYARMGATEKAMQLVTDCLDKTNIVSLKSCEEGLESKAVLEGLAKYVSNCFHLSPETHLGPRLQILVCALYKDRFGEEHPDTMAMQDMLAKMYMRLHELQKALAVQERVYQLRCKLLGEAHADTVASLELVASNYASMCTRYAKPDFCKNAVVYLEKYYRILCSKSGKEHADTLLVRKKLRRAYWFCGEKWKALTFFG